MEKQTRSIFRPASLKKKKMTIFAKCLSLKYVGRQFLVFKILKLKNSTSKAKYENINLVCNRIS